MQPVRYVSRLRWERGLRSGDVEVPHIDGRPVPIDVPAGAIRVREWPNRLGVLEEGSPHDSVVWHGALTNVPPDGNWARVGDIGDVTDLHERTRWLRKLLKRLEQAPGVLSYVRPSAPCAILLTAGFPPQRIDEIDSGLRVGVEALRIILPEFPGGLQLRFTDIEWDRAEEYAGAIERLVGEDG